MAYKFPKVNLASEVTGVLPVANGGSGAGTLTNHGVVLGQGTSAVVATAAGSAGQVLQSGGASADPVYSTATYPSTATGTGTILRANGTNWVATTATYPTTTTVSQILYSSATNVIGGITTGNNGLLVTGNTGIPSILAGPGVAGKVLLSNSATAPSFSTAVYPSTASTAGNVITSDGTNFASSALPTRVSNALATLATTIANVTGDNTFYGPIVFDTATFNVGSNYAVGTGFYTAPVTGKYLCCCSVSLQNLGIAHVTGEFRLLVNGSTYTRSSFNPYIMSAGGIFTYTFSLVVPATATETLSFGCVVAGGTKTVGIQGNNFGNYSFASFTLLG